MTVVTDEPAVRSVVLDYVEGWFDGDGTASVRCVCHRYVDLLHLIEMLEGWKIADAAWRVR